MDPSPNQCLVDPSPYQCLVEHSQDHESKDGDTVAHRRRYLPLFKPQRDVYAIAKVPAWAWAGNLKVQGLTILITLCINTVTHMGMDPSTLLLPGLLSVCM